MEKAIARPYGNLHIAAPGKVVPIGGCNPNLSDEHYFSCMYGRYYPALLKYLECIDKKNRIDKEDILQDIFLNIWKKGSGLAEIENIECYLVSAAKKRMYSALQKAENKKRQEEEFVINTESSEEFWQQLSFRETFDVYEMAKKGLSPRTRRAHELRVDFRLSRQEIASAMNISQCTVKEFLSIARKSIKATMYDKAANKS
jgi:RNA polymerase sigma factor (sigma-70 family)